MKNYKFLDHTADIIFEATGKSVEELFENCGLALEETMVNLESIKHKEEYNITLETDSIESLLYDFLSELLFIKDTEGLLFNKFKITIIHKNKKHEIIATCVGEKINRTRHELFNDTKAITKHQFKIENENGKWKASIIVDI